MSGPSARVILHSKHPTWGQPDIYTLESTFHRFVLAEFNTHRRFSRNSASSRAIPVTKQINRVLANPAIPLSWPMEIKGMQGGAEVDQAVRIKCERLWLDARDHAVEMVQKLQKHGVHKSVLNRLLEPFMWHTVITTATEWENFFTLRCSPLAQPEIRAVAESMRNAMQNSTPQQLQYEEWHLPLVTGIDAVEIVEHYADMRRPGGVIQTLKKISAARCARVSYLTHDGVRDWDADLGLADRLLNPGDGAAHLSPLEHVARPATYYEWRNKSVPGNFEGWHQFRHEIKGT